MLLEIQHLLVIPFWGFKGVLELSLNEIVNGTTVPLSTRLSDSQQRNVIFSPLIYLGLALPVTFTQPLQNQQAEEGGTITLSCEISKPNAAVQWKKAGTVLRPSSKYKMRQAGSVAELTIHNLSEADAGEYTCDTGDQQTAAAVVVKGGLLCGEERNRACYRGRGTGLRNLTARRCPALKPNRISEVTVISEG